MKKKLSIILLCPLLFCTCGKMAGDKNMDYDYLIVTEYVNEYNADTLVKSFVTSIVSSKYSFFPSEKTIYEHSYTYDSGKLVLKNEYMVEQNGFKTLRNSTIYSNNTEEWILWKGNDTLSYNLYEYDSNRRPIHTIRIANMSVPEFEFVVADNLEEWSVYDTDGHEVSRTVKDLLTGETSTINYFYNKEPIIISSDKVEEVCFNKEVVGDTIVTKRYENGILMDIHMEYENRKSKWELHFTPEYELVVSEETFEENGMEVTVYKNIESQWTDSVFYMNDREIKSVMLSPEDKTTVFTDYDSSGNVLIQKRYTKFNKTKM